MDKAVFAHLRASRSNLDYVGVVWETGKWTPSIKLHHISSASAAARVSTISMSAIPVSELAAVSPSRESFFGPRLINPNQEEKTTTVAKSRCALTKEKSKSLSKSKSNSRSKGKQKRRPSAAASSQRASKSGGADSQMSSTLFGSKMSKQKSIVSKQMSLHRSK